MWPAAETDTVFQRLSPDEQLLVNDAWLFLSRVRAHYAMNDAGFHGDALVVFRDRLPSSSDASRESVSQMLGDARLVLQAWLHYDASVAEWIFGAETGANPALLGAPRYAQAHDVLYHDLGELQRRCAEDAILIAPQYARAYDAPWPLWHNDEEDEETKRLLSNLYVYVERAKRMLVLSASTPHDRQIVAEAPKTRRALLEAADRLAPLMASANPALVARFGSSARVLERVRALLQEI